MQKTLILWDIDGTLLHSGGAGMKALEAALGHVFGVTGSLIGIEFAGRTDPWIIRQVFARFGIEPTPENFARYIDGYVAALPDILSQSQARVLPGVRELVAQAASHPHVVQGLLTGNLRRGAQTKLGFHGMWDTFPVGAFADDSEVRNELGPHALRRAQKHWGLEFSGADTWIVGDTPHDIACGKAFGARTLAVATGASPLAALQAFSPDAVLGDLSDARAFWRAIGA
ncbi:MAG TPA: HAD family hydrolase [Opitutaceae bacterium]|jgi:phosphoglycolate phosphatase-like HAD superfamily hydrolase